MNIRTSDLSTIQQRKLCSICWKFEQLLDSSESASAEDYLSGCDEANGLDRSFLLAELQAIQAERSQKKLNAVSYKPPQDQRYQMIEEIARGGSAVVWRMRDNHLQRDTAVKCLLDSQDNRLMRSRLEREARLCARLVHPCIVPIHELSQFSDGRPFVSMKLVEGRTLQQLLDGQPPMTINAAIEIFAKVCQAMAYAHQQRIVHRDLKPANIMVGKFGEVQIMDWGLAKELEQTQAIPSRLEQHMTIDQGSLLSGQIDSKQTDGNNSFDSTIHGVVFGTIAYMSPEQATGQVGSIDTRSDVFSLGAILCRILTGFPPYHGSDPLSMLEKAQRVELTETVHNLRNSKHRQLAQLATKCLLPNPEQRPEDAGQLAFLLESAIKAKRIKQRLKLVATVAVAGFFLLASLVWVSSPGSIDNNTSSLDNVQNSSNDDQDRLKELAVPTEATFLEFIQSKQYGLVLKYYKRVLSDNPNRAYLHYMTAVTIVNLQMFEAAEPIAKRYTELESNDGDGYFVLSRSQYFQGKLDEAKQSLIECRRLKQAAGKEIKTIDDKLAEIEHDYLVIESLSEHPIEYFESLPPNEISDVAKVCTIRRKLPEAIRLYKRLIALENNHFRANIIRYNAIFKVVKASLISDSLDIHSRNLVAEVAVEWLAEQHQSIVNARNTTTPDSDISATAGKLTELLKKRSEGNDLRNYVNDDRIEKETRERLATLFKQIDAL